MKAQSLGLGEITIDNILTIDLDGKVVAGNARRHSKVYIHSEIFHALFDVEAVCIFMLSVFVSQRCCR